MKPSQRIISANPFFSSLIFEESLMLSEKSQVHYLSKGDALDLFGEKSVYFLDSGIMESVSTAGKGESNFFNPGSFFGALPFSDVTPRGELRALSDVKLISLSNEDCINLFSISHKAMRGYIKAMKLLKYPLVRPAEKFSSVSAKVIAVCGASKSGKTLIASALARVLSENGKTVILDLSYGGSSVFDIFNAKIMPPFSQKEENEKQKNLSVVQAAENIDLLNVSHGSMVKCDSTLISPILFSFSFTYNYIIMDISDYDEQLRDEAVKKSDYVIDILSEKRNLPVTVSDAQLVVPVRTGNSVVKNPQTLTVEYSEGTDILSVSHANGIKKITEIILKKRKALYLAPCSAQSIGYIPLLSSFYDSNPGFDAVFSTFFPYVLAGLFAVSAKREEFVKSALRLLNPSVLNSVFDINFPGKYLSSSKKIVKFMRDLFGESRIEQNKCLCISHSFSELNNAEYFFSSGELFLEASSSISIPPLFEGIGENKYCTSFGKASGASILRFDYDEITAVHSAVGGASRVFEGIPELFSGEFISAEENCPTDFYFPTHKNIFLDLNFTQNNLSSFNDQSIEIVKKQMSEQGFNEK
ncbi:MAG: hypothetical protein KA015_00700 [Spirochaetes bacterium]|nr:hypothetical protein [Spirochaetota bacterium]